MADPFVHPPRVLGIVQAGGKGSRLDVLTRERAKPALPFAGSYRLVDLALSNLANSGISDVWVSVQYAASSLDAHLAGGRPWDLDRTRGGYRRLVPEQGRTESVEGFSSGNVDDLLQMSSQIRELGPDVVVAMSADQVFRLDLRAVVAEHLERGAEATLVTTEVSKREASHKTVVEVDRDGVVTGLDDKPSSPASGLISAEVFVYDAAVLLEELQAMRAERAQEDPGLEEGMGDFPDHLLPRLVARGRVRTHPLGGYWRDLGRPSSYLAAHRDLTRGAVDVFDDPGWPMMSRADVVPPANVREGAELADAVLASGCEIHGTVRRSVLGPGCVVEAGAVVEDSVLMSGARVERDAHVAAAVVDEGVTVGRGARVGAVPARWPVSDGAVVLVGRDSVVGAGVELEPGARLEPGTTA